MLAPWKKSYGKPRQHNKNQRHYFTSKGTYKAVVFPVIMYGYEIWNIKKAEGQRIDAFELCVVLEKTHENPLDCKKIKPVNPKGNPEYSLEELTLKLQYLGHLMRRADSLEKTLMLGKIEGWEREGDDRRSDGWMVSPTQWT